MHNEKNFRKFVELLIRQSIEENLKTGKDIEIIAKEKLDYVISLNKLGISSDMVKNADHKSLVEAVEEIKS